jgi:hypothetical protein
MRASTAVVAVTTATVAGVVIGSGIAPSMAAQERITVCHKLGTPAEHEITVAEPAVAAHERHGDTLGACPLPAVIAAPQGLAFTVRWATADSASSRRFDVQYRVGAGRWRAWTSDTTATRRVFGAEATPARVASGRKYAFRVRPGAATTRDAFSSAQVFRVR